MTKALPQPPPRLIPPPFAISRADRPEGWTTADRVLFASVTGGIAVFVCFTALLVSEIMPSAYDAKVRIKLDWPAPAGGGAAPSPAESRPRMEEEMALILGDAVLDPVVAKLDLGKVWGERYGAPESITPLECRRQLRRLVQTHAMPNTTLFDLLVTSSEPPEAAQLANEIARVYQSAAMGKSAASGGSPPAATALLPGRPKVVIVEEALRPQRPSRPNVPLNVALGAGLGLLIGAVAGLATTRLVRRFRRRPGQGSFPVAVGSA